MSATLKLVSGASGVDPQVSPRVADLHPVPGRGVQAGARLTLPSRVPVEGSLPWLRAWYSDAFRRGALVRVNGARGWIASAAGGFVNVRLDGGGSALVRPGEIDFPLT